MENVEYIFFIWLFIVEKIEPEKWCGMRASTRLILDRMEQLTERNVNKECDVILVRLQSYF